jgi:predicted GNAT superfamily acetyltransferase
MAKKPPKPRANAGTPIPSPASLAARLRFVEDSLTKGMRPTRVMETLCLKYGVCEAQAWADIATVRDRWAKEDAEQRPRRREEMNAAIDTLVSSGYEAGDLKAVRAALALKAQVNGLVVKAVQITEGDALTPEERETLRALLDRAPT